jgi:hypothetical protein
LKLRKACGLNGIPNECLRHLPRRPLVHLTHLFNHCLVLSHFPKPWKEAKVIMLPKPSKDPRFPQNLHLISHLSTIGKLFEKVIMKIVRRHIEQRGLLNESEFGFHASHSSTLQSMRLTDHITKNFNINMSMAAVFLDIEEAFDSTWYLGVLYKLPELKFLISLIKLISFLSQSLSGRRNIYAKVYASRFATGLHSAPTLYSMYVNDTPQTPAVYLGLFMDDTCICTNDTCIYATRLQRGLCS